VARDGRICAGTVKAAVMFAEAISDDLTVGLGFAICAEICPVQLPHDKQQHEYPCCDEEFTEDTNKGRTRRTLAPLCLPALPPGQRLVHNFSLSGHPPSQDTLRHLAGARRILTVVYVPVLNRNLIGITEEAPPITHSTIGARR